MGSKYKDLILEGRWKYKRMTETQRIEFENIYNHKLLILSYAQVKNVIAGKTTIGKIVTKRIPRNNEEFITNNTLKKYKAQRAKYAEGGKKRERL